jgi:hypothetical protein
MARINLQITGTKYGRLTAVRFTGLRTRAHHPLWLFRCDCGREKIINLHNVLNQATRSCGCLRREMTGAKWRTHGARSADASPGLQRAYVSWAEMHTRCKNPNRAGWQNWGGRGIKVCRRWSGRDGFAHFVQDMGERPAGTTLDRIKVNLGYFPENCRWADAETQAQNRRNCYVLREAELQLPADGAAW